MQPGQAPQSDDAESAPSVEERLGRQQYREDDCLASIRGMRVPIALGLPLVRRCVVRGIRHHPGFAEELRGVHPVFARALNARSIMSNVVPDVGEMNVEDDSLPYCIWHPEFPSPETLRRLVERFPQMRYHAGRASAAAGYTELYMELDILPEVHIAEEARESGSREIFELIMAAPVRYSIMDDYARTVDLDNPKQAWLNGDTAPRWSLDVKQRFREAQPFEDDEGMIHLFADQGYDDRAFDIDETMNIDEFDAEWEIPAGRGDEVTPLLSMPLPLDLPTLDKDVLILMAAYHGNIERYARLRRPQMIARELHCCVRGIYHNTSFALWWQSQQRDLQGGRTALHPQVSMAINARLIMNNVLSTIDEQTPAGQLPYLIWYPTLAAESTYRELARRRPDMTPQILRACIAGRYTGLFDELLPASMPDPAVVFEAEQSPDHTFRARLEQRIAQLSRKPLLSSAEHWKMQSTSRLDESGIGIPLRMGTHLVGTGFPSLYNGLQCSVNALDMYASMPEDWKRGLDPSEHLELDYVEWPASRATARLEE